MRITDFSLRHPLVVAAVTIAIGIFGVFSYATLGVAITPNVNFPTVVVTTLYPGADPQTVESNVTKPIEDAISTLPNIDTNGLISLSSQGVSTVTVQFNTSANAELVSVDVERVVNGARNRLPSEVEPPIITKVDINAFGVATVILSGPQSLAVLQDLAENVVQKQFNALPGVGATNIRSGITREIQVLVDEGRLRARGLSINNVVNAVQTQQIEVPAGTISQSGRDYSVYFDSLATSAEQLENLVVLQSASGAVRLRDVATIEDTYKRRTSVVRYNGHEGLALVVVKLPDANTIAVVDEVKRAIERLQPQLPADTRLDVVIDSSTYTAKSFNTVQRAMLEAVLFTGLILLLFLHSWRSTLIVLVSIPTSLLVTLVMMAILDYNLNLLTMMALTLSVGILVDDSIVVLENIHRHFRMGKAPVQAALDGRNEIGLAAITITFVDVVVYVPIAIMLTGVAAQFIRPFALTIAFATLASLLVSFTLTPLLASRSMPRESTGRESPLRKIGRAWDRLTSAVEHQYGRLLGWSLPRRWAVIAGGLASFALGIGLWVFGFIGSDFFPSGDQSEVDITLTMPASTALDVTNSVTLQMEQLLLQRHDVKGVFALVGVTTGGFTGADASGNQAQLTVLLVPPHDRAKSSAEIGAELRQTFAGTIPGAKVQIGLPNAFGFGGFGGQPIQVQVQGIDPATVDQFAAQVEEAIREVPGAASIRSSNENRQTQIRATVDWARAADLGVTPQNAGIALRTAIDGFRSNTTQFRRPGLSSIDIRVLGSNARTATVEDIAALPVSVPGGVVRLDQFATLRQVEIPTSIRHVNRLRAVTIGAEPDEGQLLGNVQAAVRRAAMAVPAPAGHGVTFAGQGQQGTSAIAEINRALGLAMLLMYMLMMMLFGSLTLPLAVLMSLPLAAVGAFGAMAITRTPFTLFSLLGLAVLVGLVGKNAILLVDYTEILRQRGYSREAAIRQAGPTRLRPIVMTTLSVMAALLPIATGLEEGSELLKTAAVVLIGGLLTSTLLTLVFVPAMYTIFDDGEQWVRRRLGRGTRPTSGSGEAPPDGVSDLLPDGADQPTSRELVAR